MKSVRLGMAIALGVLPAVGLATASMDALAGPIEITEARTEMRRACGHWQTESDDPAEWLDVEICGQIEADGSETVYIERFDCGADRSILEPEWGVCDPKHVWPFEGPTMEARNLPAGSVQIDYEGGLAHFAANLGGCTVDVVVAAWNEGRDNTTGYQDLVGPSDDGLSVLNGSSTERRRSATGRGSAEGPLCDWEAIREPSNWGRILTRTYEYDEVAVRP